MLEVGSYVDGKYKILSEIGHGGMSVVYMALNEKANKTWAIKEVRKDGKMDFNTVRQGLMAEIETLKKLKHANLPSIVDVIEDENSFIIVMDYIEGQSLDKILRENGAQPEDIVVEWAKQLCDVFGYLHTRTPPIIYRDMKPANVMLKPDGDITVIDFGTAKNYEINLGETTGIGTIGYAAPEQYIGSGFGRTDARTDIYCLGMTLYHLLTNIDPCKNLISDRSIRAVNPAFSYGLDRIICKCTNHNPDDRYQSCAELMYDLEHYRDLDPIIRKQQKKRLATFIVFAALTVLMTLSGTVLNLTASRMARDTYVDKLDEAMKTTDYQEKVTLLRECIEIPNMAAKKDAYLSLIQTYKENDAVFTVDEAGQLEKLIKTYRDALKTDIESYTEVCFEIGKLYWYYYDYGGADNQITKAKSAIEWFQDVVNNAPENYANIGMAKVYSNVGRFYRDITTDVTEASDKGKYSELFLNLNELLNTVAADEKETEIVRLEMIELARSAIRQYATKFKTDGVEKADVLTMVDQIAQYATGLETTTTKTDEMKDTIITQLSDTREAVELSYGSKRGG